jgi:hypothetical protein
LARSPRRVPRKGREEPEAVLVFILLEEDANVLLQLQILFLASLCVPQIKVFVQGFLPNFSKKLTGKFLNDFNGWIFTDFISYPEHIIK